MFRALTSTAAGLGSISDSSKSSKSRSYLASQAARQKKKKKKIPGRHHALLSVEPAPRSLYLSNQKAWTLEWGFPGGPVVKTLHFP